MMQVSPAALALNGACEFRAPAIIMDFGLLDPSSGQNASAQLLVPNEVGSCKDLIMTVDADNQPRLLTHTSSSAVIPYTFEGLPFAAAAPGNNKWTPFTFRGLILWNSYANAPEGTYRSTVTISVTP